MKKDEITIYTDGSSMGNPGPGGWGAVVIEGAGEEAKVRELGGREKESTNNRMEMMAALEALKSVEKLKLKGTPLRQGFEGQRKIKIHTDSSYLLNGITMWVYGWVKNNWQTKTKEAVLNKDLWEPLYKIENNLKNKYEIEWIKVSGHAGVFLNERCDTIATSFSANNTTILFTGVLKQYEKLFGVISQHSLHHSHSVLEGQGLSDRSEDSSENIAKHKKKQSSKTAFSYVSFVDGKMHVDKTWALCEKRVKGKSGAKYKKVFSKEEERDLIALWTLKSLF